MAKKKKKAVAASRTKKSAEGIEQNRTIKFDYIKSNCFRVIRVDGVHGSPTPGANGIQVALFSERNPIPQREEYELSKEGGLGTRIDFRTRGAVVREVEVEAILSIDMARRLEKWLHEKIEQVESLSGKGEKNER